MAVVLLPVVYVASFGPACWLIAAPRVPGVKDAPRTLMRFYFPIGALIHRTKSYNSKPVVWWITLGSAKRARVIVPTDASGRNWYGFTRE